MYRIPDIHSIRNHQDRSMECNRLKLFAKMHAHPVIIRGENNGLPTTFKIREFLGNPEVPEISDKELESPKMYNPGWFRIVTPNINIINISNINFQYYKYFLLLPNFIPNISRSIINICL
jgi:hypothetical protein